MMSLAKNKYNYFFTLMTFLLSFYLFKDIRYTDDFDVYENYYYLVFEKSGDAGYDFLERVGRFFHLTFYQFYNYILGLQLIFFICLFRKYKVNASIGLLGTILILYVQMANQIRYFLALPLFLIAMNYLFCQKKYLIAISLLVISFSFHNGIVTLFSFVPLYYIIELKRIKKMHVFYLFVAIGLLCLYIYPILYQYMTNNIERFEHYSEIVSRLATLFYLVFPCLCLWIVCKTYKGIDIYECSDEIRLSYNLTFFVIVWMIVSFSGINIINARYVNALFPIWLTCMLLSRRINKENKFSNIVIFLIFAFSCKYILPVFLFSVSDIDKIIMIWSFKQ